MSRRAAATSRAMVLCPGCGSEVALGSCDRCGTSASEGAAMCAVWGNPPTTFAWSLPLGSLVFVVVLVLAGAITTGALYWTRGGTPAAVAGCVGLMLLVISSWAVRRELRSQRVRNEGLLACGRIDAIRAGSTDDGLRFDLTIDLPGTPLYQAVADHSYSRDTDHMPRNPKPGLLVPVRVDRADRGFVLVDWRVAGARGWKRAKSCS